MQTITVICRETYPDPLIYTVQVADPTDEDAVRDAVLAARLDDLDAQDDPDLRQVVEDNLQVFFAFPGDLSTVADWRE
jgi:hypothetical protein